MACFYSGDDESLSKALNLLPKDFILKPVADTLKSTALPVNGMASTVSEEQRRLCKLLWTGGVDAESRAQELIQAINNHRFQQMETIISSLAQAVYPENPDLAKVAVLRILALAVRRGHLGQISMLDLVKKLLPRDQVSLVSTQVSLMAEEPTHERWDVSHAARYLDRLPSVFPNPRDQKIAKARLLQFLARSGRAGDACPFCMGSRTLEQLWFMIGDRSEDVSTVFLDLVLASLRLDPEDRAGYDLMLEVAR
jgi:hypothetical protein